MSLKELIFYIFIGGLTSYPFNGMTCVCGSEKDWLRATGSNKRNLKMIFINKRKVFDRAVQRRKRSYWVAM